jgi:hypothetical protein
MAVLTATPLSSAGVTVSGGAAAGASGDQVDNSNGDAAFVVNNGSGSPITVTKVQQATGPTARWSPTPRSRSRPAR